MRQFRIGSVLGIPLKLDLTFLLILPLFAWSIASQLGFWVEQFNGIWGIGLSEAALTSPGYLPWVIGFAAAIGLFVGVVLHELGHSVVAMRYGFPIESITLWIFGGIAQLTDMPEDWRQELAIAIAGPIVSFAIGGICYLGFVAVSGLDALRFVIGYLALTNVVLGAFNLLPGFPMDGGRVLRALLARTRPYARATKIAAEVGKGFAVLLGLFGLLQFNIILIGLAFFIYIGASSEAQQTMMKATFEGVTVRDVMTPVDQLDTVGPDETVAALIERMFRERHTGYPVVENGRIVGLVTLADAQEVDPVEREAFTVEDVMTRDLTTIAADADAMSAFMAMQRTGVGRLLVTQGEEFVGLVTRSDLVTAFNIIRSSGSVYGPLQEPGRSGPRPGASDPGADSPPRP